MLHEQLNSKLHFASASSSSSSSPFLSQSNHRPSLFDLSLPSKLEIDQVYWNGLHTLHRFEIKNTTSDPIKVKLKSNMGSQIAFQLTNENLVEMETENESWVMFHPDTTTTTTITTPTKPSATTTPHSFSPSHSLTSASPMSPLPIQDSSPLHSHPQPSLEGDHITRSTGVQEKDRIAPFSARELENNPDKEMQLRESDKEEQELYMDTFQEVEDGFDRGETPTRNSTKPFSERNPSKRPGSPPPTFFPTTTTTPSSSSSSFSLSTSHLSTHSGSGATSSSLPARSSGHTHTQEDLRTFSYSTSATHLSADNLDGFAPYYVGSSVASSTDSSFSSPPRAPSPFPYIATTNTASAAALGAYASSPIGYEFNQLFNYVNHIDELRLDPHEARQLILAFLPPAATDAAGYDFQEVAGILLFYGYRANHTKPDTQVSVKFKARICRSLLCTDLAHHLLFDECLPHTTSIRDFTIWNKSEIDLYFVLNTADVPNCLTFTDSNTGEPLDSTKRILPYSYCGVRVTYKPTQVGDFFYEVQLENVNDSSNVEVLRIHCVVRSALTEASFILVGSGSTLDFGDVCAGQCHTSQFTLKNVSENPLDLHLSAEGAKVLFDHAPAEQGPIAVSMRSVSLDSSVHLLQSSGSATALGDEVWAPRYLDGPARGPHHIDEIVLKPGLERTVFASYFPEKAVAEDYNAACLMQRTFRILLQFGKERKAIQCRARVCTSFITVAPHVLSFGDTDVGTFKSLPINITNISEIPARVQLSFASKVLSCPASEIAIFPRQSVQVKLDIFPRKVNPDYRKEITVVNLLNRDNNQIVEVRSTNLDTQHITWHSLFYRIMTPMSTNYLDFGSVVGHFFALRTFTIQNVSKKELVLNITSSTEHITLYNRRKKSQDTPSAANTMEPDHRTAPATLSAVSTTPAFPALLPAFLTTTPTSLPLTTPITAVTPSMTKEKKQVFETMADRKTIKRTNSDLLPNSVTPEYLDLAVPKKAPTLKPVHTSGYDLLLNEVDDVLRVLQQLNLADVRTIQRNPPEEHKFVKCVMMLKESLDAFIQHQDLVPLPALVPVPAEKEVECIAVLRAPMLKERRKKLDSRLIFALVEYDAELLPKVQGDLPVREFLTRCVLCPSLLEVAQRNINFGTLELQSEIRKAILVRNKSDVPLLFAIKKSGSIASGDIVLEHRLGVVPPHGSREVSFVFQPSMSGVYLEKLIVENVQNPENVQTVCLKANVRKSHTFNIHTEAIDFGKCMANELSTTKFITLQNTDKKQPHLFTVRAQEDNHALQFEFSALSSEAMQHTQEDVEEKIESLEQKLKIAKRKGHADKIEKINEAIGELRRTTELVVSAFQEDPTASNSNGLQAAGGEKKTDLLTLLVEPNTVKKIAVQVRPKPILPPTASSTLDLTATSTAAPTTITATSLSCHGFICIHRHKNTDILKRVAYSCLICYDPASYMSSLEDLSTQSGSQANSLNYIGDFSNAKPNPNNMVDTNDTLTLETESVDLGKFILDHETPFYFVLMNKDTFHPKSYLIQDPCVTPQDREGVLVPGERKIVNATFLPTKSGKQSHEILILSNGIQLTFTLHYVGVYKDALTLKRDQSQVVQDIDLGFCYNPKKYTARAVLFLESAVPEPVKISALSTLVQQAAVFLDEACTVPLTDTWIDPQQPLAVYLAVQPNLIPVGPMKKGGAPSCLSRQLVGGFKFTGTNASGDEVCSQNIRFQATIGHSLFQVSPTYLNLGYLDSLQPVHTSFTVANLSDKMPLHFKATSSCPKMITIQSDSAQLVGYEDGQEAGHAVSKVTVPLILMPTAVGYYREHIFITNLNCPESSTSIETSLFVDPHRLSLKAHSDLLSTSDCLDSRPFVLLQWDNVYLYVTEENEILPATTPSSHPHEIISLTNTTEKPLILFAKSDSCVQVDVPTHPSLDIDPPLPSVSSDDALASLVKCGPYIALNPGGTMQCQIAAPSPPLSFTDDALTALNQGKKIKTRGILTFCEVANEEQVLKVVELQAFYCIAKGEVVQCKSIQLKAKRGEMVHFTSTIKNVSTCPLHLHLQSPPFIRFQKPTNTSQTSSITEPNVIPPSQTVDLFFALDTSEVSGGNHEWTLVLKNAHNPLNSMSIPVSASVSCLDLTISGGDLDDVNVLCLPPVWIPNFNPDLSCDAWFNLTNTSSSEVRFTVSVELIQPIAELIQLLVLSRFSNSPLNWLTLPANGSIEVKVKAVVLENAKLTKTCPKWMLDERGVQLGKVFVENENGNMTLPVRGKILEQVCFELDSSFLEVSLDVVSELHITNLSPRHPLTLTARPELLHELDSIQLHLPTQIHLDPGSVLLVPLKLEKSELLESGDIMWIHFEDQQSLCNATKSVKLRLREVKDLIEHPTSPFKERSHLPTLLPENYTDSDILVIKGCTKKDKIYELDVGQQDVGSPNLARKISLELHQPLACRFLLKTIPHDTSNWFIISKMEGHLDPVSQKSQTIFLTLNPSVRNTYYAYLIVENLDYPADLKFIKVSMEVVGRLNPKKQRPFDLVCNGLDGTPIIRYEDVYYGNEYTTRSFRIYNRESIPLEFSLNVQGLVPQDETQILFSNSTSSRVLFKEISVPPESSSQVFLRFYPAPGALDLNRESKETKHFEIQVHSRLIRDYLQTVTVYATCWFPRIQISTTNLIFMPGSLLPHSNLDPSATSLTTSTTLANAISSNSNSTSSASTFPPLSLPLSLPASPLHHSPLPTVISSTSLTHHEVQNDLTKYVTISNLHLSRYVPVVVLNDSMFFEVSVAQEEEPVVASIYNTSTLPAFTSSASVPPSPGHGTVTSRSKLLSSTLEQELQPGQHLLLRVNVNVDAVMSCLDRLKREKYIQEYFAVYHQQFPTEHFFVTLKLSFGHLDEFSLLRWNPWQSSKFVNLENRIYHFLKLLYQPFDPSLPFQFHILVDQLVYYATTTSGPIDHFYLLSSLLWTSLKQATLDSLSPLPLEVQKYWRYFLSFFTQSHPILENLQRLYSLNNP